MASVDDRRLPAKEPIMTTHILRITHTVPDFDEYFYAQQQTGYAAYAS